MACSVLFWVVKILVRKKEASKRFGFSSMALSSAARALPSSPFSRACLYWTIASSYEGSFEVAGGFSAAQTENKPSAKAISRIMVRILHHSSPENISNLRSSERRASPEDWPHFRGFQPFFGFGEMFPC